MRVLVDECLPRQLQQWLSAARPDWSVPVFPANRAKLVRAGVPALVQSLPRVRPGEKAVMHLAAAADWSSASLAEVVAEQGISRHVFRR